MSAIHIFLTGEIQVGKTTVIQRILSRLNLSADGFLTYWEPDGDGRSLYLSSYSADKRYLIASDKGEYFLRLENMTDIFNTNGVEILECAGRRDIIVMDELGVLESAAHIFQNAALRIIDGSVPVLGVIKPARTEFLDAVRAHPNVSVYEVTAENRNSILETLLTTLEIEGDKK